MGCLTLLYDDDQEEMDDDWEYVEEGPAEIIWQGNEIIVRKKKVRVPKRDANQKSKEEVKLQQSARIWLFCAIFSLLTRATIPDLECFCSTGC